MVQDQLPETVFAWAPRLVKRACIARSGIYLYTADDLPNLHLMLPPGMTPRSTYNVYRPATVMARTVDLFTHLPLTHHHAPEKVTPENFRKYTIGWSGDEATIEAIPGTEEIGIYSMVTIGDREAFEAYDRGHIQLSPEYKGVFEWSGGVTAAGQQYDIVMRDVEGVNHLAMVPAGRGGAAASVLDHAGGIMNKFVSGLWRAITRRLAGGVDDRASFKEKLDRLVADREKLTADAVGVAVEGLKADCSTLPDSPGKLKLIRFVEDMRMVKDQAPEASAAAAKLIADEYATLDAEAMAEVPEPKKKTDDDAPTPPPPPEKKDEEKPAAPAAPAEAPKDDAAPQEETAPAQPAVPLSPEVQKLFAMIAADMEKWLSVVKGGAAPAAEEKPAEPAAPAAPVADDKKGASDKAPTLTTSMASTDGGAGSLDEHFKKEIRRGK